MKSLRDAFFDALWELHDDRIIVVSGDCGAPALDRWKDTPQFMNVGISEQNMIAIAMGLALSGKRPYCYAITPFATLRCLDQIRVACIMNLPITVVGLGTGYSYWEAGATHHAIEDIGVMRMMAGMRIASPFNDITAAQLGRIYDEPTYIRLDRGDAPKYIPHIVFKGKQDITYYPIWIKPFTFPKGIDLDDITEIIVEEEQLNGGLGTIVRDYMEENHITIPLKRIHLKEQYGFSYGRDKLRENMIELS